MQIVSYISDGATSGYRALTFNFAPTIVAYMGQAYCENLGGMLSSSFFQSKPTYGSKDIKTEYLTMSPASYVLFDTNQSEYHNAYKSSDGKTIYFDMSLNNRVFEGHHYEYFYIGFCTT